jgi:hypothetical protein
VRAGGDGVELGLVRGPQLEALRDHGHHLRKRAGGEGGGRIVSKAGRSGGWGHRGKSRRIICLSACV